MTYIEISTKVKETNRQGKETQKCKPSQIPDVTKEEICKSLNKMSNGRAAAEDAKIPL